MMTPDRNMVQKIQNYDRDLFVKWNNRDHYFEVWRKCVIGEQLITPVTESIYKERGKLTFMPLDERILWWLYAADSWGNGGPKLHALKQDKRWKEFEANRKKALYGTFKDRAKDMWRGINNFYFTKTKKKNKRYPSFNSNVIKNRWVKPDCKARTSGRLYARTKSNALAYNYDVNRDH